MTKRLDPNALEPGADGQYLMTSGGRTQWGAAPSGGSGGSSGNVILIENGANVPAGTPVGTIVFEKAVAAFSRALALSPAIALSLDETSGNFADQGSNGIAFTPGAGVVRGLDPLQAGGYAVSGSGTAEIASLATNPASFAAGVGTVMTVAKMPAAAHGSIIKFAGTSGNGWSLDCGNGPRGDTDGNHFVIGRNGVTWIDSGYGWSSGGVYVLVLSRDSSGAMRLWANASTVWSAGGQGINAVSGGSPILGWTRGSSSEVLVSTVQLDCAAWWDRVLTDAEIKSLGAASYGGAKGWWDGSKLRGFAA